MAYGEYTVVYIVKESKTRVTKTFDNEFLCRKFVNKLKHSKVCDLVSYPFFN